MAARSSETQKRSAGESAMRRAMGHMRITLALEHSARNAAMIAAARRGKKSGVEFFFLIV